MRMDMPGDRTLTHVSLALAVNVNFMSDPFSIHPWRLWLLHPFAWEWLEMNIGLFRCSSTGLCKWNASERTVRQSHDQAVLCRVWNCAPRRIFLNLCGVPRRARRAYGFLYPTKSSFPGGTLAMLRSVTTMMQAPCGILFLWVIQAYGTLAFLSTGYRNTGEPTAGEPVIVSTCRILTASRGKLKDGGSFVVKSSAVPPGKLSDEGETQCCPKDTWWGRQTATKCHHDVLLALWDMHHALIYALDYKDKRSI